MFQSEQELLDYRDRLKARTNQHWLDHDKYGYSGMREQGLDGFGFEFEGFWFDEHHESANATTVIRWIDWLLGEKK